mmetsp:Transcript_18960/g.40331  ORF Transcript_18960/g.40331 Transcript_18960/m.40331 type:complete len:232 (-) Transcript_18960:398-1093(-)
MLAFASSSCARSRSAASLAAFSFSRALTTDFSIATMERNCWSFSNGTPPPLPLSLPKILSSLSASSSKPYSPSAKLATSSLPSAPLPVMLYLVNWSLCSFSFFSMTARRVAFSFAPFAEAWIYTMSLPHRLRRSWRLLKLTAPFSFAAFGEEDSSLSFSLSTSRASLIAAFEAVTHSPTDRATCSMASEVMSLAPSAIAFAASRASAILTSTLSTSWTATVASVSSHSLCS